MPLDIGQLLDELNTATARVLVSTTEEEAIAATLDGLTHIGVKNSLLSLATPRGWIEARSATGTWSKIVRDTVRRPAGDDVLAIVAKTRQPVFIEDSRVDPRCEQHAVQLAGIISQYMCPLASGDSTIGVLQVDLSDHAELREESAEQFALFLKTLDMFAAQAAIGISNARNILRIEQLRSLLASAAHEFRAPLHNILQLCAALRYTQPTNVSALEQLHEQINSEIYRAKRHMDNYLMTGIQGREAPRYNFQKGDVCRLVRDCASRFRLPAASRGITIELDRSLDHIPDVVFDSEHMEQVFGNLLDNAVKYSYSRKKISIKAKVDSQWVRISVTDYGLGIPTEHAEKVFRGYQRSEQDYKGFVPGSGLGLAIAKEIVDRHKGVIEVESIPSQISPERDRNYLTTFTVFIPRRPDR